ncbi:potassium-transporting ATPase subunit KdpA [Crenobacter sp. SG2303]|uniref:Potassium-transporting ATPase potassium-binding subunit n=1 Tax=Crenobacter oryzisoli TaxID=3056844 RepID=A0ABT7XTF9_9NEIS|nr:potassium-transporting ATPase subunit KdpA [Crenobacter sp. SG2303]MDN0077085.1 potassium-transporting ATPase subunit KdpA [Crenobacter sp. SG2303]
MNSSFLLLMIAFLAVLGLTVRPMGAWMAPMAEGRFANGAFARFDQRLLRLMGVDANTGMGWKQYTLALIVFNALGALLLYALQRLQGGLPFNPQHFGAVSADSSFDTAVSFVTNTNWQGYSGESTMSYLTQMMGLAVQNFLSAATGIAIAFALIRGFSRRESTDVGNFWADVMRITLYLLLPMAFVMALVLVNQGVLQNLSSYVSYTGFAGHAQTLAMGPVASQEAIKMIGTNGGGFFNANSAHPFENPTALTNFLQMLAIFIIPAGLCHVFGRLVKDTRQGWAILAIMTLIFVACAIGVAAFEQQGNPLFGKLGIDQLASALQAGGNMEGKEVRFGISASSLFAAVTTAASCGAVNAMHDSFTALGGMIPMWLIQLGEVIFGGVGSGLYGMLVLAILAVFVAGLMVGRTPEYLGKKIEPYEMKMVALAILVTPTLVLLGTSVAVLTGAGQAGVANPGPHGFSEILYAFSSAANNNGSAFAGLSANTPFYNGMLAAAMWFGRFAMIVPVMALAGSLAKKKILPVSNGTMPTHDALFVVLVIGTVLLVGALTYIPALALGPIVEHLSLWAGH